MPTEKQINDAIDNCHWKNNNIKDVVICNGQVLPCLKVIDNGDCPILKELFRKDTQDVLLNTGRTE